MNPMHFGKLQFACWLCLSITACGTPSVKPIDRIFEQHIKNSDVESLESKDIPPVIKRTIPLPLPVASPKTETYSVVVTNVSAQEILFALARDAKINLDIQNGIQGTVTLNAIDQTLPRILSRMAKQVDMRYELDGTNLVIMPDTPFLRHYKIDYVNMTRDADGVISNATQVGSGSSGATNGVAGAGGNNSSLTIKNISRNHFWDTLIQNIKDILHETDQILPAGSSETVVQQSNASSTSGTGVQTASTTGKKKSTARQPGIESSPIPATMQGDGTTVTRTNTFREAASVIANPESGIITVRATGKQHEKIQEFIDQVMSSVRRQVLIEATIVEVSLSDQYQQGINWSKLLVGSKGFQLTQAGSAGLPASNTGSMFTLDYANPTSSFGNLSAQISLLELPVDYYHVVFTLPAPISALAYTNKAVIYRLLFEVAAETLRTIAADPKHLGAKIGATLVLHTWGSSLTHHPHAHGIVPGGGLSLDGERWVSCKPGFFLSVRVLSRLFRRRFLEKLELMHRSGQLQFFGEHKQLSDATAFAEWLAPLRKCEWVCLPAYLAPLRVKMGCWRVQPIQTHLYL